MPDHRDLALAHLAADEADLAATCAGLREALRAACDRLRAQHVELTRLRARYHQLLDERRAPRRVA